MDTPIATPGEENLPGREFRDRKGRTFAQILGSMGDRVHLRQQWQVRGIDSTGSTNVDLARAADEGAPDLVVLVADHQTAGKGRLDRRWEAPPGVNLLVSILFRSVPDRPHELTRAVGLAAVEACRHLMKNVTTPTSIALKWPNDIVIGKRKLGGILASASTTRSIRITHGQRISVPDHVVVGLGLNVRWAPEEAVSLVEFDGDAHRDEVLASFLIALDGLVRLDSDDLHDLYRSHLSTIGHEVRVEFPSGDVLVGRALGVDLDGRLEVLDSCAMSHHIDVADIVHLRFAE